jgi:hypothetical protein
LKRERHKAGRQALDDAEWRQALQQAGIEFLDQTDDGRGEGVRFRIAKASA